MAVIVPAVLAAVVGGAQLIKGSADKAKADRIAKANARPDYKINPEDQDNLNLARYYADQGLPDATKETYLKGSERGLSSTIDAILKGGGNVNSVTGAYDAYNNGLDRLSMLDDQQRISNLNVLMTQNRNMSEQRDKEFQVNKYAPYADKAQAALLLSKNGDDNMWQGIGTIAGGIGNAASGFSRRATIDNIIPKTKPTGETVSRQQGGMLQGVDSVYDPSGFKKKGLSDQDTEYLNNLLGNKTFIDNFFQN